MASNVAQGSTRLILIGSAMLLSIGMGLRQSLGLFLTPVTRDLALTAADFTLTIAIQNIVCRLLLRKQSPARRARRALRWHLRDPGHDEADPVPRHLAIPRPLDARSHLSPG